ncbi:flagellar hook-associated protein FlgL [Fuchsiella alkaliacetigena]|uniref:flagellar hook-associated protein FlgL n=1 Tax=Fuchsiella alkaliacetigena TaxID=957042 RepID=UPI00200B352F|nr:flagellar hook-associated protein FlgL [Fuchsiella alkaliacetigena]MCK8824173.1 flagellar hook-associated protein FlgL [Fuchsiella alkaliacetigena]
MSRITNNIMINDFMKNYNRSNKNMNKIMNQLSTGKKFSQVSEAPIESIRAMKYGTTIEFNERYQENVENGIDWLEITDQALDDANNTLRRARDLAVQGATESSTQEDRDKIRQEIDEIKEHLVQIGNTTFSDRHVFSGTKTRTAPYVEEAENDNYYNEELGDVEDEDFEITGNVMREIGEGVHMSINITGSEVGFNEIFQTLDQLSGALDKEAGDDATELIQESLGEIDEHIEDVLSARGRVGAQMNRLEMTSNRLDGRKISYTKLLSDAEDVDVAKAITDLKQEENAYRASLNVGARLMDVSLVDFLR